LIFGKTSIIFCPQLKFEKLQLINFLGKVFGVENVKYGNTDLVVETLVETAFPRDIVGYGAIATNLNPYPCFGHTKTRL